MKKRHRVNILLALGIIVVVLGAAFGLGSCAFQASVSSSLALDDSDATSALVAPAAADDPYYVLVAGVSDDGQASVAASYLSLLRVDPKNNTMALVNIPNNIAVTYANKEDDMLRDALHAGGNAELIRRVSGIANVDIAHYVRINESGFVSLVDGLGGIDVDVTQRVDDPMVSSIVLSVGQQTLDGQAALTYVSSTNYLEGRTDRAAIQAQVLSALIEKISAKSGLDFVMTMDSLSHDIKTDMDYAKLVALGETYGKTESLPMATMPGSQSVVGDQTFFSVNSTRWNQMREQFTTGNDPNLSVDTSGIDKAALSLVVRNGSGTDGFAIQVADKLTAAGYVVQDTGNADSYVYNETLVIYKDQGNQAAAQAIVDDLGVGRAVYASVYYSLATDIQVVVGKDWKPLK